MSKINHISRTIPVIRVNNRNHNLAFYNQTLGMKTLLEEGALVSLGDQSKTEKLVLEEVPSTRARKVEGPKKLARIILKVADAKEIESLLAQIETDYQLYQGVEGYAFEVFSPEGDRFLLHAEEDRRQLLPLTEKPIFEALPDFAGLSQFELEKIEIHVPNKEVSQLFYQRLLPEAAILAFKEARGEDLLQKDLVWDLSMLKFSMDNLDLDALEDLLRDQEIFVPKSRKFLLTEDGSHIELWFEQA